jgi:hypothetical protein
MTETTKPTPLQNETGHLGVEGPRADVAPTSPNVPTGTLITHLDVKTVAKASPPSSQTMLDLLKMILTGASLNEVLMSLARILEAEGMLCSIWLVEKDGVA